MIEINSNRINVASGGAGRLAERRKQADSGASQPAAPKRAHINIIPAPESLATMIRSAVASLRQGMAWDRGTILNLLV